MKNKIIAIDLHSFSQSRTAGPSNVSLFPFAQKSTIQAWASQENNRDRNSEISAFLLMLTAGLLVFQHLLPDSLSLSLSLSLHISLVPQIYDCPRQVRYYWVHVMPKASLGPD